MPQNNSVRTFRSLTRVIENVTVVTLAEDAGVFKKGDALIIKKILNDQGLVLCQNWGSTDQATISLDTKLQEV